MNHSAHPRTSNAVTSSLASDSWNKVKDRPKKFSDYSYIIFQAPIIGNSTQLTGKSNNYFDYDIYTIFWHKCRNIDASVDLSFLRITNPLHTI